MKINELDKGGVTQQQLDALEKVLDQVFSKVGIDIEFTRHFVDRVNDERNIRPISIKELAMLFKKEFIKYGKPIAQLGPDAEAVMKDLETDINIPFALKWNGKELELIAKTVMRKKNFRTPNKEFPVENVNEDFGSIPPLAELIIMAVAAKTTVDVLKGMFKVAIKTGKGINKLRKLQKKAQSIGQGVADYALGEATREELLTKFKDRQKERFYQAALDALHRLVTSKGSKQSIGGYSFDIARAFNGIDPKELEKMYKQINEKSFAKGSWSSPDITAFDTPKGGGDPDHAGVSLSGNTDRRVSDKDKKEISIQMQLRKAFNLDGKYEVAFQNGERKQVDRNIAGKVMSKIDKIKASNDKLKIINVISQSYENLIKFANHN